MLTTYLKMRINIFSKIVSGPWGGGNQFQKSLIKYFKTNNIYTASTKKGTTGGIIYYELGPTRPDLILKDLIKITNPTLLPNYKLSFFEQMK